MVCTVFNVCTKAAKLINEEYYCWYTFCLATTCIRYNIFICCPKLISYYNSENIISYKNNKERGQ